MDLSHKSSSNGLHIRTSYSTHPPHRRGRCVNGHHNLLAEFKKVFSPKMFQFWRVSLVCSLLIQSHCIGSAGSAGSNGAVLRVAKGALNNAVSGPIRGSSSLKNVPAPADGGGDLLGGLVGGLLGGGSGGGLLSGILGGGSGGGLLGGLLGGGEGGGLLGGVLGGGDGGGGLLGGLLGGGNGGGGLLGGLLGGGNGGGGLLGGLLGGGNGGGGLLGGLLGGGSGGGGLLGGVLGGGNAGGGVPRADGGDAHGDTGSQMNGGIHGNGGLLGGLLGGGGVLGILGNGGILGTVQGITGLRIIDLTLPKVSLRLLPGIGVHLNLYTKVAINGNSLLGLLDILVEVNITARTRLTQEASGVPRLVIEDCQALLGGVNVRLLKGLLSGILDGLLNSLLRGVLPGVLCPVVNVVLGLVNGLLLSVNSMVPLGLIGSIQYTVSSLPIVTGQFIQLDLNTVVSQLGGGLIDYPLDHAAPISMPPMMDATESQLGLSSNFLGCVLTALQKEGLMDIEITDGDVPGIPPLTTAVLGGLIPKVSLMYKKARPLVLNITVPSAPVVSLQDNRGIVMLFAQCEVFVPNSDSSQTSLCVLGVDVRLNAQFSVRENKLKISLSLDSSHLSLASSSVGPVDVSVLEGLVGNIFNLAFLPTVNTVVGAGIPLPRLMNIDFSDANIDILNDLVVLST
ncbi:BPI fold-containing family B member 4-like [Ascaphus truei]|uniref:BPI fold-containing family B member 4-like n=1 Tax=Ascaphus truei TaxID=8439 RepID=UPI003F59F630